jgi:hypothetical protein
MMEQFVKNATTYFSLLSFLKEKWAYDISFLCVWLSPYQIWTN